MQPTNYGGYDYTYYADGRLKEFWDRSDQIGNPQFVQFHYMSRRYVYDQAGRVSGVGQLENYSIMPPFTGAYGYDAFDNLTSRSGQYAMNPAQSDSGSYTNNRRSGWNYNPEGQVLNSSDNSDSGGSSTRAWTYDAAGRLTLTSELRNGQTTTLATGYDGNGNVNHEIINGATGDYLIHSSVLGTVLTKLKVNGGKDITYVPTNGLVSPMQMQDQPGSSQASYLSGVYRDPLGIQENNLYAIDPFGALVANTQPQVGGPPSYIPVFGASYSGVTGSSFTNANNFSSGCLLDGRPADCNTVRFELQNNPFVQLDLNHSRPWTGSRGDQTPQLPFGIREEWRLVQPGQRAPQGAKTRSAYSEEFVSYAHYSFFGGENFFPDPQDPETHGPALGQTLSQADCDKKIAAIFGGPGAVAATVNEPSTLQHPSAGKDRFDHLAGKGVFHLYTNAQGTEATTGLYMPPGGRLISGGEYYNGGSPEEGGKLENYFRFLYSRGPLQGVTISFVHVGGTSGGEGGGQRLGRFPGQTNAAGSIRIGNIGGLGGDSPGYNHSHIKVYRNSKLTDPRKVFCK